MEKERLTERQKRFADYFLELGNAKQAAAKAGLNEKYSSALRKKPAVKAYIEERLKQMANERIATATEVLEYLTGVMRGVYEEGKAGDKNAAARMKAAELLGKRYGVFAEDIASACLPTPVVVDDIKER